MITGYFPNDARLILNPTDYTSGGDDLGELKSIQAASIDNVIELGYDHVTGNNPVRARITGVRTSYVVSVRDYTEDLMDLVHNNVNTGLDLIEYNDYNLGEFITDWNSILVRPVDKDGDHDPDKPHVYIPRVLSITTFNPVFNKQVTQFETMPIVVIAMQDPDLDRPEYYGDYTNFPEL